MSAEHGLPPPPDVDLDEFLRSLKKANDSVIPEQGTDQQSSYLPNTHQGNAGQNPGSPLSDDLQPSQPPNYQAFDSQAFVAPRSSIAVTESSSQTKPSVGVSVAGGTVQENAPAGTVVAKLGAADPDAGDSFSYALAADPSGKFELVGDEIRLKAGATLDYETASSHQLTVAVTDAGGLTRTEPLTIAVTNQNEAPTDITVAGGTVQENAPAGTLVAKLGAADPDAGDSFTYALAADPSGKFELVGDEIRLKAGATPRLRDGQLASAHRGRDRRGRPDPHRAADHRRHQSERGPHRHHGRRRHGAGECRRPARWWPSWGPPTRTRATASAMRWPPIPRASSSWSATRSGSRPAPRSTTRRPARISSPSP